ncbi:MAG: DUF4364 family protein [Lachnospiraceae bacterium]|nr:DUF4364 family protein [Lachnospiraceae bacterium]
MAESNIIYKIMVLNLLSKVNFPLSTKQVTDFFLERKYTDYFTIQQTISDLVEAQMIDMSTSVNSTQYTINEEGERTLELFPDRITPAIEEDMKNYFAENSLTMKKNNSVTADYYYATGGGYLVHCRVSEEGHNVVDINLHVTSKEQAEAIVVNWKAKYEDVYMALMDLLVQ